MFCAQERPNHNNSTASCLLSEVKYCQALLVLQWGTMLESKVLFFLLHSLCSITWMTHEEGLNAGSIISQQSLAYNTVILQPKSLIGIGLWNGLWAHLNHLSLIWSKTYGKLLFLSSPHFVIYDCFHFSWQNRDCGVVFYSLYWCFARRNDQITITAPLPVCSAKLNIVKPC